MTSGEHSASAAILSADAVGYSRLISEDEDATVHTITVYREQIAILVEEHQGRVVDFTGDNLLAEFRTARDAVICAIEVQRVLRARNASLSADHRMDFRMGIHMGDVRVEGGRIYGDGVNIAARLEALADAGGICISSTVHDQVRHRISVDFEDLGEKSVKNIPDPVRVYRALLFAAERAEAPAAGVAALLIWGTGGEFGSTARARADPLHRRSSPRQLVRRGGAGVLRRRANRGAHGDAGPHPGAPGDLPNLGHAVQGRAQAASRDRAGAGRRRGAEGDGTEPAREHQVEGQAIQRAGLAQGVGE